MKTKYRRETNESEIVFKQQNVPNLFMIQLRTWELVGREAETTEAGLPHSQSCRPAQQRFRMRLPMDMDISSWYTPVTDWIISPPNASVHVLTATMTIFRNRASKEIGQGSLRPSGWGPSPTGLVSWGHLDLGLQCSELWGNRFVLFFHPVCGTLFWQPLAD